MTKFLSPSQLQRLTDLPSASQKRVAIRVKPSAERKIRDGHPWLYEDSIIKTSHSGKSGDIAVIFDRKNRFLAIGLFDPDSFIRVKIVHANSPTKIDDVFWHARVESAFLRRQPLWDSAETNGFRCINGENDGFPGLILDRYADSYVLKLYSTAWLPHLKQIVDGMLQIKQPKRVLLRLSRRLQKQSDNLFGLVDGAALVGNVPDRPILFHENGLSFEANIVQGQKTGHFLDQRDNRQRVRQLANGKSVLDMFAATGGFTVYAAAGGAKSVISVDISAPTLAVAERNLEHNSTIGGVPSCQHSMRQGDAFALLNQFVSEYRHFDMVILDPPSFAQKSADVANALQAYRRLAKLGLQVLNNGGQIVMASCSSRVSADIFFRLVWDSAEKEGVRLHSVETSQHAIDHPVTFAEGAYLKCLIATVDKETKRPLRQRSQRR